MAQRERGKLCYQAPSDSFRDENLILAFRLKKRKVHYNREFYFKKFQADWDGKHMSRCAGLVHASFQGPGGDLVFFTRGGKREDY